MLNKVKNILLKQAIKNHKKSLNPFVLSELQKVVFLIDENQDITLEINVLKEAVSNPVMIEKIAFTQIIDAQKTIMHTLFTPKDFNWYKKPVKEDLVNFLQENYDLVIDLTEKENEYQSIFLQFINSKVVTGFKGLKEYSINLNIHDNNLLFIEELLRYLSTFKK
ncbi:hypothetical protein UJ101_00519 [Flavobacteriaceae bacterium UJ101]|nr:hypothetical protein UJ101_00519 [Flavobacteriaceae bacterium UJ101]